MQEVRNSAVWIWHEVKDVNSIRCLKNMSVWIMNEKGKRNVYIEKFKPDFSCWYKVVIGEGILPMFRCATAKDFHVGILDPKWFSAKRTTFEKATLF